MMELLDVISHIQPFFMKQVLEFLLQEVTFGRGLECSNERNAINISKNDKFQRNVLRAMKKLQSKNRLNHVLLKGKIGTHLYRKLFWRKTPLEHGLECIRK